MNPEVQASPAVVNSTTTGNGHPICDGTGNTSMIDIAAANHKDTWPPEYAAIDTVDNIIRPAVEVSRIDSSFWQDRSRSHNFYFCNGLREKRPRYSGSNNRWIDELQYHKAVKKLLFPSVVSFDPRNPRITMNETTKLSGLSYKQLQALAIRYKVPGNIRKGLLIKVLEAVREGDDLQVNKLLRELHQTRKKRAKKSTKQLGKILRLEPITNYSSNCDKDICYSVNLPQAQRGWVMNTEGEETTTRDSNRDENQAPQIPIYSEFNQFLGDGIQDEYCYHATATEGNANERSQSPAIVDLRINPYRIGEWSEIEMHKNNGFIDFRHQNAVPEYKTYSHIDPSQMIQYESPRLLKKMLQAPVGVNLKQLVNYEDSHDNPPINNDTVDDSDTLTADSDINVNESRIDSNQQNNNWLGSNPDNMFRPYGDHRMEHYGLSCNSSTDVIENCQKWLANSSSMLINNDNNTQEIIDNDHYNQSHVHYSIGDVKNQENAGFYHNSHDQYYNFHVNGSNDNQSGYQQQSHHHHHQQQQQQYDRDMNVIEEIGRVDVGLYRQDNENLGATVQNSDHQWATTYAVQQNQEPLETFYETNVVSATEESQYEEFHIRVPEYEEPGDERCPQYMKVEYPERRDFTVAIEEANDIDASQQRLELFPSNELAMPDNVDCYWPLRSLSSDVSTLQVPQVSYKLENLLNLENTSYQGEQIKSDQTSSVYCYTSPIVTQRIFSTPSPASQRSYMDSEVQASPVATNCLPCSDLPALNCQELYNNNFMELPSIRSTVVVNSTTTGNAYPICEDTGETSMIDYTAAIHNNTWLPEYAAIDTIDHSQCYNR